MFGKRESKASRKVFADEIIIVVSIPKRPTNRGLFSLVSVSQANPREGWGLIFCFKPFHCISFLASFGFRLD